jgi:hypothetical protein
MNREAADYLELGRRDEPTPEPTRLRFIALDRVFVLDSELVYDEEATETLLARTRPAPADFVDYLAAHAALTANPRPVTIAGRTGTEVRVQFADVTNLPGTCAGGPGPCLTLLLTPKPFVNLFVERSAQARFIVLDSPGGRLLIEDAAPDQASIAQLDEQVDAMLATLQVG